MTGEARTITARGWPYKYRARIEHRVKRGRDQWRYVIEQKWVHWSDYKGSRRRDDRERVKADANAWLDLRERDYDAEYVTGCGGGGA